MQIHCLMVVSVYKLKPNSITCDFERALMNAFRTKFPNADMYGCLYQCLIIMAFDNTTGVYVPILYILMTTKTEEHYLHAIHCLMVVSDYKLKPNSITCDFERALMSAFRTKFPNADMFGCLFHSSSHLGGR